MINKFIIKIAKVYKYKVVFFLAYLIVGRLNLHSIIEINGSLLIEVNILGKNFEFAHKVLTLEYR